MGAYSGASTYAAPMTTAFGGASTYAAPMTTAFGGASTYSYGGARAAAPVSYGSYGGAAPVSYAAPVSIFAAPSFGTVTAPVSASAVGAVTVAAPTPVVKTTRRCC